MVIENPLGGFVSSHMHMADRSQYAPRPMVVFATDILGRSMSGESIEQTE